MTEDNLDSKVDTAPYGSHTRSCEGVDVESSLGAQAMVRSAYQEGSREEKYKMPTMIHHNNTGLKTADDAASVKSLEVYRENNDAVVVGGAQ